MMCPAVWRWPSRRRGNGEADISGRDGGTAALRLRLVREQGCRPAAARERAGSDLQRNPAEGLQRPGMETAKPWPVVLGLAPADAVVVSRIYSPWCGMNSIVIYSQLSARGNSWHRYAGAVGFLVMV